MNIQLKTINYVIAGLERSSNPLAQELKSLSISKLYHKFFNNFRMGNNDNPKGLSLTPFGFKILSDYLKSYAVDLDKDYKLAIKDLVYLDAHAKMPYFIKTVADKSQPPVFSTKIFFFEVGLGIMLKLADGKVSNLRDLQIR